MFVHSNECSNMAKFVRALIATSLLATVDVITADTEGNTAEDTVADSVIVSDIMKDIVGDMVAVALTGAT